jgi:hypothetical protein
MCGSVMNRSCTKAKPSIEQRGDSVTEEGNQPTRPEWLFVPTRCYPPFRTRHRGKS